MSRSKVNFFVAMSSNYLLRSDVFCDKIRVLFGLLSDYLTVFLVIQGVSSQYVTL